MADDLFTPTITPAAYAEGRPPWRPGSLVYPAVFGGALAATVLALVNARRLRLPVGAVLAIVGTGLAALVARLAITVVLLDGHTSGPARLVGALSGVLVWSVANLTQKGRFRTYEMRGGQAASLVLPGIAAALGLGIVEAVLIVLAAAVR
ncbi:MULTISPECIES: hypothetical protein [Micromonospora]|uniref:Uncharacterized protein n=1 Tax=Micromonospora sicca TaxID=2202420 RepID=A0A317DPF5_9ACTN|nr:MULTISPECIES: hypothetical protein [unclassified Micromonospora]MBM0225359.1 hypothetical protein [Micromonospora sp. ATA51]PWR15980.1 hypothetical protein DKT69_08085 [Micromonospora sp. 4G51]